MLSKDDFAKIASLFGPVRRDLLSIKLRIFNVEKKILQLEKTATKNHTTWIDTILKPLKLCPHARNYLPLRNY